jgi:integrase
MSVYKPAKSRNYQYDFVIEGRRFHGSTGVRTQRSAEAVERLRRQEAAEGRLDEASLMSLDVAAGRWWSEHGKDLASAPDVERRLGIMLKMVGAQTRLVDITTAKISTAVEKRRLHGFSRSSAPGAKTYLPSNTTVNRDIVDTLRPILRRAKRRWGARGLHEIDWAELLLSEPKPRAREFSSDQLAAILEAVRPHWRDLVRFAARYGCRLSELFFALDDLDVDDPESARVCLRDRKGGDDHVLPLLPSDATLLAARARRARSAGLDTVWYREVRGGRLVALHYFGAESAIRTAMTTTGLRASKGARGPHDLRHHGGMQILRATGNLRVTQRLLGHASIQSTLVYAHALEGDVKAGLALVSRNSPEPEPAAPEEAVQNQLITGR